MGVPFYGDYDTTETVNLPFNAFSSDDPSASVTVTNLAAGDIEIHKDGGTTQRSSDSGVTVSIDFDSVTGNHMVHIDLSDNTDAGFYAAGSRYQVRLEGITVDGATLNVWIGAFSIGCVLRPTTAGRKLDVTATGAAGIDWANVENPTTAVDLSATDIQLCDTVTTLTGHTVQTGDSYAIVSDGTFGNAALETLVDELETIMKHATYGLAAIDGKVDDLEGRLTAARAGYLDNLSAGAVALASVCTEARLAELAGANLPADVDTLLTRITAAVALASVCTEGRLAELDAANIPTDLSTIDTAVDAVKAETALIVADTDELQTDDTPAALVTINDRLGTIENLVDDLETRLSAARAGYLDELDVSTAGKMAEQLDKLMIALGNKVVITEANGNTEQFDDAGDTLGSIAAAFSTDGTYTTRKRLVI